ncbi:MAG: DUF4838 domain-containing protein [Candidatus Rifleibacteriota bacterium]
MNFCKKTIRLLLLTFVFAFSQGQVEAEQLIIKDGEPNAEIVISENPERPRMTALAALELQKYLQKITGVRIPIVSKHSSDNLAKIYVGESRYTKKLGIKTDDLKYSAFRIKTDGDWLALIGRDIDFVPPEPWSRGRNDYERALAEWDKKVGDRTTGAWGFTYSRFYGKRWNPSDYNKIMAEKYGEDNRHVWNPEGKKHSSDYQGPGMGNGFWFDDRGGSLNAVYQFLRNLGVRWYMPGEKGEVVPSMDSVLIPEKSKTVHPDFPIRCWLAGRPNDWDGYIWKNRIGIEGSVEGLGYGGTHGLGNVLKRNETKEKHPEFFALFNGFRITKKGKRKPGQPCFNSEALMNEAANYVKFRFEVFGEHTVQLSPPDGMSKCQCDKCKGKSPSELVFGFQNEVAKRLYKEFPDKILLGAAYTMYKNPPKSIEKFSPNFAVSINNCARPSFRIEERWKEYWKIVEGWRKKLAPQRLIRVENNRYEVNRPIDIPVIHPRAMAKDMKALKGISLGERNEISIGRGKKRRSDLLNAPGCSHLTLYVNARYMWDADQDIEKLLSEYFTLFYGPAAGKMEEAFTFAEEKTQIARAPQAIDDKIKMGTLVREALEKAPEGSIYARRIQTIIDEMVPMEELEKEKERLAKLGGNPRKNNPVAVGYDLSSGKELNVYKLKNLKTGEKADIETTFIVGWNKERNALVFDIKCMDDDMENLFPSRNIWDGDSVAVLLESPNHAYYQLEINPNGKLFDADRYQKRLDTSWSSRAEIETEKGKDFWRIKVLVPVVSPEDGLGDPKHYVVGTKPSTDKPWYFNVGRVRVRGRDFKKTAYIFNPTGGGYHVPVKFAKLIIE